MVYAPQLQALKPDVEEVRTRGINSVKMRAIDAHSLFPGELNLIE